MNYLEIESVVGREILDSRGNPTVRGRDHAGGRHCGARLRPFRCIHRRV